MGGIIPGGGGGGGGSSGGGSSQANPVGMEWGGPPNADVTGAADPNMFNTNAMNTGDVTATDAPATNIYAYSPAASSEQAAQATGAPPATTAPGGQPSGGGLDLGSILSGLFGMRQAQAATPTRPGGPAAEDTSTGRGGSYGWPSGPPTGRDPYGNTYTTQPGYQASPMSPLPPYSPSAGSPQQPRPAGTPTPAPAAPPSAPSPSPQPSRGPQRSPSGENIPLPRSRPAEADATPPPEPAIPPATKPVEEIESELTPEKLIGSTRAGPGGPTYTQGTPVGGYRGPMTADQLIQSSGGAAAAPPATVSPQSVPAPGNRTDLPQGAGGFPVPNPNSPLERLFRGDLPGAVNSFIDQLRAQNPNIVTPNEVNRTLNGDTSGRPAPARPLERSIQARQGAVSPGTMATARAYQNQDPRADPARGVAQTQTPAATLMPGVPPMTAGAAYGYQRETGGPRMNPGFTPGGMAPVSRETPVAPDAAGTAGATVPSPRAPGVAPGTSQSLRLGQPNQTPQQTEQIYQAWLRSTGLPDNPNTRTRFNIENGTFRNMRNQAQQQVPDWRNERNQPLNAPGQTGYRNTPGTGNLTPAERANIERSTGIAMPRPPSPKDQGRVPQGSMIPGVRNQAVAQEMTPQERINQVMGKRPGSAVRAGQAGATTEGMRQTRKADREILRDRFLMDRERNMRAQQQRWEERRRGRDPGEPLDAPLDVIRRNRRIAPSNRYELS